MTKTIIVAGYGPGISRALAHRFGREDHQVALVARTAERVAEGAKELAAAGIRAQGFVGDLARAADVARVVAEVRGALGPITALHWNAYAGGAGDVTTAPTAELETSLGVAVVGLVAAVQAALPDLRAQRGAVLVTNGGLGLLDPGVNAAGVQLDAMGLSVANAAKRKLVALLALKLAPEVYVGEVVVTVSVKGSAWDSGDATLEAATIAQRFWDLYQARTETSVLL